MAKIIVYTMDGCGYCDAAKSLLKAQNLDFIEENISNNEDKKLELIKKTKQRTLPQIFIDDVFVGGYTELKSYFDKKS